MIRNFEKNVEMLKGGEIGLFWREIDGWIVDGFEM